MEKLGRRAMKAAIMQEPGRFVFEDRPVPEIGPADVLVRTYVCGLCTSELDMWEGHTNVAFPRFAGHEVAGVVEAVGEEVTGLAPGDRVAVYAEGEGFAEYVAVPGTWVVKLTDDVPFAHALGEPIACAVNGVRKARPELNESVCVVGCGFMGLLLLQLFKLQGAGHLVAVDTRDRVLALAASLGATHTFNPARDDVEAGVRRLTGGRGVDIGVEGAGLQATLDLTTRLVRMEGKLEVFGFHQGAPRSVDWGYWNWMAFEIVNGHTRTRSRYVEGMRTGLDLVAAGKLHLAPLVTHRFALDDINEAFATASARSDGYVKGVIEVG